MPMNEKTAYLAIRAHFKQPGAERSTDYDGTCLYRSYNYDDTGAVCRVDKCAMGVLVPDDIYEASENIEGTCASDIVNSFPAVKALFHPDVRLDVLDEFQAAHDTAVNVKNLLTRLDETAVNHGVVTWADIEALDNG